MSWSRSLPRPLVIPGVMQLVTLVDALARGGIFSRTLKLFSDPAQRFRFSHDVSEARAMLLLREYSSQSLSENLGRTAFGLFVAGLVAWLIVLYWTAPFDF